MKYLSLNLSIILSALLFSVTLKAETTTSLEVSIVGDRLADTDLAKLSFYEKCAWQLNDLSSQMKDNLIAQSSCRLDRAQETFQSVRYSGLY